MILLRNDKLGAVPSLHALINTESVVSDKNGGLYIQIIKKKKEVVSYDKLHKIIWNTPRYQRLSSSGGGVKLQARNRR